MLRILANRHKQPQLLSVRLCFPGLVATASAFLQHEQRKAIVPNDNPPQYVA